MNRAQIDAFIKNEMKRSADEANEKLVWLSEYLNEHDINDMAEFTKAHRTLRELVSCGRIEIIIKEQKDV